jgi:short-subunit dehydrogenase
MARRTLQGSRVVITGASSGIGRELARALAHAGAQLLLVARREDRLLELAKELTAAGGKVLTLAGDVTDPERREAVCGLATKAFGGLDVLVNNAGIGALGRFDEAKPERLRQVMEVNFFALVEMTRAALPLLAAGRNPLIVNISSILGHRGIPLMSEYSASKFAVQGFSESLRAELATRGIDVLVASPGTTETEFFTSQVDSPGTAPWSGRRGVPADVVARRIVRAIERGRHEVIPSFEGRILVWLNRLSPRLTDVIMRRMTPPG